LSKHQPKNLKCPECGDPFKYANVMGAHRRHKHGVPGSAPSVVGKRKRDEQRAADAANARAQAAPINEAAPPTKRKYTKRSELATLTASTKNGLSRNGHHQDHGTGHTSGVAETAVAVAFGRFQELCASVSFEFDVPPRTLARRLGTLIARSNP
jgi:hypothetical protein